MPVLVFVLTVAAFLPVLQNGFVNWDDDLNFTDNPDYRGLSPAHLRWMFTTFHMGLYQPLSWLTLGLDYTLWGLHPSGYHLTSLLLHAADAVLFYVLLLRVLALASPAAAADALGLRVAAALGALAFAVHPLRLESVAWATERRDVVSGLFALLTVIAYLRMQAVAGRGRRRWLVVALGCFALALLSKALCMTLPVVLLVLDIYPLRRLARTPLGALLAEKIPFLALALGAALVAIRAQQAHSAMRPLATHGVLQRLAQSAYGLCFYLGKTIVPVRLSPLYLLEPRLDPTAPRYVAAMLVVVAITAMLVLLRHRWPSVLATWVAYAVTVSPVVGLVQNGPQIAADRYSYVACLPWAVLAAGGVLRAWVAAERGSWPARAAVGGALAGTLVLGFLTFAHTRVWRDSRTLWDQALRVDPRNHVAWVNRGWDSHRRGDLFAALRDYEAALRIAPRDALAYNDRGVARQGLHDLDGAIADYSEAIRVEPGYADAYYNRGTARQAKGDTERAIADFSEAIRSKPSDPRPYNNRGSLRETRGDLAGAIADYGEAVRADPRFFPGYLNRGRARKARGDLAGAAADWGRALALAPPGWTGRATLEGELAALPAP
jgi:tetratricopeptide (TPR) repeat protein